MYLEMKNNDQLKPECLSHNNFEDEGQLLKGMKKTFRDCDGNDCQRLWQDFFLEENVPQEQIMITAAQNFECGVWDLLDNVFQEIPIIFLLQALGS